VFDEEWPQLDGQAGVMVDRDRVGKAVLRSPCMGNVRPISYQLDDNRVAFNPNTLEHNVAGMGVCGAPFVMLDWCVIGGIHVAGRHGPDAGHAAKITREMLDVIQPTHQQMSLSLSCMYNFKELQPVSRHCRGNYIEGSGDMIGSYVGHLPKLKSRIKKTCLHPAVSEISEEVANLGIPTFKRTNGDWETCPYRVNLKKLSVRRDPIPSTILGRALDSYIDRISPHLQFFIIDDDVNVNGIPGSDWARRINMDTSSGFPLYAKKKNIMPELPPDLDGYKRYGIDHNTASLMDFIESQYDKNLLACPPFNSSLKSEVRSNEKLKAGKIRMFQGISLAYALIQRRYSMCIVKSVYDNRQAFEMAIGMNPHSDHWRQICPRMNMFAGDYKGFDSLFSIGFVRDVFNKISTFCIDKKHAQRIQAIGAEAACPYIIVNNDLIRVYGINASGQVVTTILNGMQNSIFIRCAFFMAGFSDFDEHVNIVTYGDDVIIYTDLQEFTFSVVQHHLRLIGITFTPADKSESTFDFQPLNTMTFLKRYFRWEYNTCMAPLEISSILKSLAFTQTNIPEGTHLKQVMYVALLELSVHPNHVFEYYSQLLFRLALRYNISLPRLNRAQCLVILFGRQHWEEHCPDLLLQGDQNKRQPDANLIATKTIIELDRVLSDEPETILHGDEHGQQYGCNYAQMDPDVPDMRVDNQEVTTFAGAKPERVFVTDLEQDPYLDLPAHSTSDIEKYLSRPLLLDTYTWVYGGAFSIDFDPWEAFLTDATVSPKLSNYQLLKANLHIKIMINGMPFHMGRMLISYWPLDFHTRGTLDTALTGDQLLVRLSQLPCYSELNPSTNTVCEVTCPFVHYKTHVNIPNYPVTAFERIGRLFMQSYAPLDTCNGNTVNANIAVYAWMSDVKLIVPTNANMDTIVEGDEDEHQSNGTMPKQIPKPGGQGKTTTTRGTKGKPQLSTSSPESKPDGVISSISSTAASILGKFKNAPVVGPYAQAGEVAANGIGTVAKLFGYSKPTIKTDMALYRNRPFGLLSTTTGGDTSVPLSFDPNHGITVDPTVTGVGNFDDMTIENIARKWSYFGQFNWTAAATTGTQLYEINVYPGLQAVVGTTATFTSMSFASEPFEKWRHPVDYRIVVVSSKMQTGRLRVAYEPYGAAYSATNTNVTYNTVLDISEASEAKISVPWSQGSGFQNCDISHLATNFGTPGTTLYSANSCNGKLYISVLNPLVSPAAGINARVLLFARAGPDVIYAAPKAIENLTTYAQSDTTLGVFGVEEDEDIIVFGDGGRHPNPAVVSIWNGERVMSVRNMIKRYCFWRRDLFNVTAVGESAAEGFMGYGGYPAPGGIPAIPLDIFYDADATAADCNYCASTYLNYFICGFVGYRGSIRWKINATPVRSRIGNYVAARGLYSFGSFNQNVPLLKSNISHAAIIGAFNTSSGSDVTNGEVMPSLEVEVPYYSRNRFIPFDPDIYTDANDTDRRWGSKVLFSVEPTSITAVSKAGVVQDTYVAAGDDFSFVWYIGPCTMDQTNYPTP
jgi:hypothetical protein